MSCLGLLLCFSIFFFKQKTAYEMRISDWSSDVCSSDLQVCQKSPVINPDTRQGIVRIALPYSEALRPGGFADARLVAGTGQAPLLPESAEIGSASCRERVCTYV